MNKRLTVKNEFGKVVYCVLSGAEPYEKQLMEVLSLHQGCGFAVDFNTDHIKVKDYYTNETVGTFEVLSFVDTKEKIVLNWLE